MSLVGSGHSVSWPFRGVVGQNAGRRQSESAAAHANFGSSATRSVGVIFQLFLTMLEGGKNNKIIIIVFSAF